MYRSTFQKITDSYNCVSGKHITYLSITSSFSLFHLNPNLFFLLLATPYSSSHILDTLVVTISFFQVSFQIIQQKPISRSPYIGTGTIFLLWQRNTLWFACHHNNITMKYFIPENIHITCMDKLRTPPSPSPDIPQRFAFPWTSGTSCSMLG